MERQDYRGAIAAFDAGRRRASARSAARRRDAAAAEPIGSSCTRGPARGRAQTVRLSPATSSPLPTTSAQPVSQIRRPSTRRAACRRARRRPRARLAPPNAAAATAERARAGAGRFRRPDAALPDQNAHAIGRLDARQLDVRALRERTDARRGRPRSCASRSSVGGPSTTHCGLPTRSTTAVTRSPATSSVTWRTPSGGAHRPRGTSSRASRAPRNVSAFGPAAVSIVRRVAGREVALERQPGRRRTARRCPKAPRRLPSALKSRVDAPAGVSSTSIRPSAPIPRWRSQARRASAATSARARHVRLGARSRKSLPYACALMTR